MAENAEVTALTRQCGGAALIVEYRVVLPGTIGGRDCGKQRATCTTTQASQTKRTGLHSHQGKSSLLGQVRNRRGDGTLRPDRGRTGGERRCTSRARGRSNGVRSCRGASALRGRVLQQAGWNEEQRNRENEASPPPDGGAVQPTSCVYRRRPSSAFARAHAAITAARRTVRTRSRR